MKYGMKALAGGCGWRHPHGRDGGSRQRLPLEASSRYSRTIITAGNESQRPWRRAQRGSPGAALLLVRARRVDLNSLAAAAVCDITGDPIVALDASVDTASKTPLLDRVKTPEDLRQLPESDLPQLADELRQETIDAVSVTGGHLGAGLGVVELTVALHWVFDTPRDRLIWDVGHQAYPHKILTGRRDRIRTLRQPGGLSGFTKRDRERIRPVRRGAFLDVDFRRPRHGGCARSRRARQQRRVRDRRRRHDRWHGLRGDEQRRRAR